jgi:hypothetical protein
MLTCLPTSLCSWDFLVRDGARDVATLDFAFLTEQGTIHYKGMDYRIGKHGVLSGRWTLLLGSSPVATAQKPSALFRLFKVTGEDTTLVLKAFSPFSRCFDIFSGSTPVGSIQPVHPFTRRAIVDCQPSVSILVQLYCFWLVVLLWRRASNQNNSAGSPGPG